MSAEDNEVAELLAGASESLPDKEWEEEMDSVRSDSKTPLSLQTVHPDEIYRFENVETSVDMVFEDLRKNYPWEDFDSELYNPISIHKWLSDEVTKLEFFIGENQFGINFAYYNSWDKIRMRKGVHARFNRFESDWNSYHLNCLNDEASGYEPGGFSRGIFTVEARQVTFLFTMIKENPNQFFCKGCSKFIFSDVEYFNDEQFAIPGPDSFPECTFVAASVEELNNDGNYFTLKMAKSFALPLQDDDEPPAKRRKVDE